MKKIVIASIVILAVLGGCCIKKYTDDKYTPKKINSDVQIEETNYIEEDEILNKTEEVSEEISEEKKTETVQKTDNKSEKKADIKTPASKETENIMKKSEPTAQKETVAVPEKKEAVTPLIEESVLETKTLEDVYVDGDSVVVNKEFKPGLKKRIFFRGVLYEIKTRITEPQNK